MACNIMSWSNIGCATQQLLIVMVIFQQLLVGVHSVDTIDHRIAPTGPFTNQTEGN
jgi:hypothetical protein